MIIYDVFFFLQTSVERISTFVHVHGLESYILETQTYVHFQIPHPDLDVLAHQVETHGYNAHSQQQVNKFDDQFHWMFQPGVFDAAHRHEVLDADLAQTSHAEERAVHVLPAFQGDERHRAGGHVSRQHPQTGHGRYYHPSLLRQLLVVQVSAANFVYHAALVHPGVEPSESLG